MKALLYWLGIIAALSIIATAVWCPVSLSDIVFLRQRWEARRIRSTTDPIAVQRWATNLLALHNHDDVPYYEFHSTNIPADILALYPETPTVGAGRNFVVIHWGRAHPSFRVGATNFVLTNRLAMPWTPGVYLMIAE